MHRSNRKLAAALLGLAAFQARGASLSELMKAVPSPPEDVTSAVAWVKDGQIVAPQYTQFKAALDAEKAAITAFNGGTLPEPDAVPPAFPAGDTPAVQAAARDYAVYIANNSGPTEPKAVLTKRERWLQISIGNRLQDVADHMTACPSKPCTDPAINATNAPLIEQRHGIAMEDVKYWGVLFDDYRKGRAAIVDQAALRINFLKDGADATTPEGKSLIARYRAAMVREIELVLSVTASTVKRSWSIDTGQVDAVSSGSRSAKKPAGKK